MAAKILVIPVDGINWRGEVKFCAVTGKFSDTFSRMLRRGTADEHAPPPELVEECKRAVAERKATIARGEDWWEPSWWAVASKEST